ncbi:MAG: hypothetical protein RL500_1142 [Pseudomonadota bacterium]
MDGERVTKPKDSRRRHSDAFKHVLVERSLVPGASVAAIAQDAGVNATRLFNWRRLHLQAAVPAAAEEPRGPVLLPVTVVEPKSASTPPLPAAPTPAPAARPPAGSIEINIRGTVVRVRGNSTKSSRREQGNYRSSLQLELAAIRPRQKRARQSRQKRDTAQAYASALGMDFTCAEVHSMRELFRSLDRFAGLALKTPSRRLRSMKSPLTGVAAFRSSSPSENANGMANPLTGCELKLTTFDQMFMSGVCLFSTQFFPLAH